MSYICYDGSCVSEGRAFSKIRALRQHQRRCHKNTPEEDTFLGSSRALKRKRADDEEEEEQRRRDFEAQQALDAANCEPEQPTVPLFDRAIDTGLQRSARVRRLPKRFRDSLPASVVPIPRSEVQDERCEQEPLPEVGPDRDQDDEIGDRAESASCASTITLKNSFGVFREYLTTSSHNPRALDVFSEALPPPAAPESVGSGLQVITAMDSANNPPSDFANVSEDLVLAWMATGEGNTPAGINNLVHNVIRHPRFCPQDLEGFNAVTAIRRFYRKHFPEAGATLGAGDGWKEGSVSIRVPCTGVEQEEGEAPEFVVSGILYRDAVEVITAELEDPIAFKNIHVTPYKEWWDPTGEDPVRVYSEIYNSDAMLEVDGNLRRNLNDAARGPHDSLETFIVSALLYSDSTHLASFGNASLWPIYLFLGNVSKYIRSKPTTLSAHHIAYIPTLPDTIKEFYRKHYKTEPSAEMLTHLGRELTHGVLRLVLGGSVADAHKNARHVRCGDDVLWRWLLHILLHSADYKEKSILATIRSLGLYLCPRCMILKSDVPRIGMDSDQKIRQSLREYGDDAAGRVENARRLLFNLGRSVGGKLEILKRGSLIPTRNAFYTELNMNPAKIMPVDILHDCELGFGKGVVTHNIRIFHALGESAIITFDTRFRQVPTFGRDTIRRFGGSVSALKKLAGRDFEDILQCWIPVLEGILPNPEHNRIILDLAFDLATWHAYAKLRLHTTHTIKSLRSQTKELGRLLRKYSNTLCPKYKTKPLPGEAAAAVRRKAARAKKATPTSNQPQAPTTKSNAYKHSGFNLQTYKIHALGDYADHIEQFGPTDCFSTQQGELEHRRVKRFYKRTNKIRFERQIAKHERMERHYQKYVNALRQTSGSQVSRQDPTSGDAEGTSPQQHYSMAKKDRDHLDLYAFSNKHVGDPALKDFIPRLKDHLLSRVLNKQYGTEPLVFTGRDRNDLHISEDRLEQRFTMNVFYTTYDLRRGKDTINMRNRPYIMTLSQDDNHPYAYARVLGIFKLNVLHGPTMPDETTMDVLWVRWFEIDKTYRAGWKAKRLYRLKVVPPLEDGAFGFLDPEDIVRGSHLIPGFVVGHRTPSLTDPASVWDPKQGSDWQVHYVNQFVDRDMFMRYRGGGIGHKYMRDVELRYEDMARERLHGKQHSHESRRPRTDARDPASEGDSDSEPPIPARPDIPQGGLATASAAVTPGSDGNDSDEESTDEDYAPSDNDSPSESDEAFDSDEIPCDDDYDSYGMAEP